MPLRKQKLVIFLHSFAGGGAETFLVDLANCLETRGYSVDLLVANSKGPLVSRVSEKITVVELHAGSTIRSVPAIRKYLRQNNPHAILSSVVHANIAVAVAHLLARVKTRLILREANREHKIRPDLGFAVNSYLRVMSVLMYRRAQVIVSLSLIHI